MTTKKEIKLETSWDKSVVPAGIAKKRGLMIDVMASAENSRERRPINLSIVIDRSGSMSGGRLDAAKQAAKGVVARLKAEDVFSLVLFDSAIETLVPPTLMIEDEKLSITRAIDRVHTQGCTNLAGGWLEGATRAAEACELMNFKTGHVVLLSDGHANEGIVDPSILRSHTDEMASRGITTSTVGVGDDYSPLQLEALSEGGLGRIHDAANPEEIIETIMGELGEIQSVVATEATLTVNWHALLRGELLANYTAEQTDSSVCVRLGQLLAGSRRSLPFLVNVPALPVGTTLDIEITLEALDSADGSRIDAVTTTTKLAVVPHEEAHAAPRNTDVADRIARFWESTVGLDAMRLNERQEFAAAQKLVQDVGESLMAFSRGTDAEASVQSNLRSAERRVGRQWEGRSKREAMIAAKKFSKGERDHRSDTRGDWSDHLD